MSGHTPGPWDLIGPITKISGGEPFYVVYADDVQIVRLKLEANARLIAAAPELLSVVASLLANASRVGDAPSYWYVREELMQKARECLAKAEGRE